MKFSKRNNQFKIRTSDQFSELLDLMTAQGSYSQADIIHMALGEYARNRYIGDYNKIENLVDELTDVRNTQVRRKSNNRKF